MRLDIEKELERKNDNYGNREGDGVSDPLVAEKRVKEEIIDVLVENKFQKVNRTQDSSD